MSLTLRILRNTTLFNEYEKLFFKNDFSSDQKEKILQLAVLLLNSEDNKVKKLGYRIIVIYSNRFKDFIPLYDVAINLGYFPVAKLIESHYPELFVGKSFIKQYLSAFKDNFYVSSKYLSLQQSELSSEIDELKNIRSKVIIAPTSYGKSELIIDTLKERKGNLCVLVPTKALVSQTNRRILNSFSSSDPARRKIIIHPDMYRETDKNVICVFTQERLVKLMQKFENLQFSTVYVDEAHNLIDGDDRAMLLASALIILEKRNPSLETIFLTPFLIRPESLSILHTKISPVEIRITETIKTERYYLCDFHTDKKLKMYDQFSGKIFGNGKIFENEIALIIERAKTKNIIYFNKPVDIEKFVRDFLEELPEVKSDKIANACKILSENIHEDYLLIKSLKKGVIYHHGSVPDHIKSYMEHLFSITDEIQFVITTSTLLEGVNIPAESLFIMDYKKGQRKLSSSQFKNLVGRVCRFSEIFHKQSGSLKKLEPVIHMLKSSYMQDTANVDKFIDEVAREDREFQEIVENALLENCILEENSIEDKKRFEEFIENFEPGTLNDIKVKTVVTQFGQACFNNNVTEINVFEIEKSCQKIVDHLLISNIQAKSNEEIFDLIKKLFVDFIDELKPKYSQLTRLKESSARNFYRMFLDWRTSNATYAQMIVSFLTYWSKVEATNPLVYVGKWGDVIREGSFVAHWTEIKSKKRSERINLAIVRIKEEQDLLDNDIMKFIEVLNDLKLIDDKLYLEIKYGTDDALKILLLKYGFSNSMVTSLTSKYMKHIIVNVAKDEIILKPSLKKAMIENNENDMIIFELNSII